MNDTAPPPSDGVIDHYVGAKGEEYFAWQGADGVAQAKFNLHLWQPHIQPTDDVLDFGCGGGFLLHALAAKRKVGVEVNPVARECAQKLGLEMAADLADVRGQFDKVITSHALEHVPHPRQAILDLKAKLRGPASRLLVLLPLDDWRTPANRRHQVDDKHMHLHAWTPSSLGNLLSTCDLSIHDVRVIQHAWPPGRKMLWNVHPAVFHAAAWCWSFLRKQRQLFAVTSLKS